MRLEIFLTLWFFPPIYIYKFFIGTVKEAIEFDNRLIMRNSPEAHEADLSQHIAQIFKSDEQASEPDNIRGCREIYNRLEKAGCEQSNTDK